MQTSPYLGNVPSHALSAHQSPTDAHRKYLRVGHTVFRSGKRARGPLPVHVVRASNDAAARYGVNLWELWWQVQNRYLELAVPIYHNGEPVALALRVGFVNGFWHCLIVPLPELLVELMAPVFQSAQLERLANDNPAAYCSDGGAFNTIAEQNAAIAAVLEGMAATIPGFVSDVLARVAIVGLTEMEAARVRCSLPRNWERRHGSTARVTRSPL